MKKLVAIVFAIFVIFMSYVFVAGFLQKQSKEDGTTITTNTSQSSNKSNSTTNSPSSANTSKSYTVSEISKHNNEADCWLLISSQVYDVTTFLGEHPGGASLILPYCGKEATRAFQTQDRGNSHSNQANDMLAGYEIGTLKN